MITSIKMMVPMPMYITHSSLSWLYCKKTGDALAHFEGACTVPDTSDL
jgi:hypothetical protein